MAGAGYKTFNSGDVLLASEVQTYLQDQAVMVFASSAARTSALPSPTEGMVSWLSDTNKLSVYDGSAWRVFDQSVQTYTPTYTNLAIGTGGSANEIVRYFQIGKFIWGLVDVTLGTTGGAVSGLIGVSTPTTLSGSSQGFAEITIGSTIYPCIIRSAGSRFDVYAQNASATYLSRTATSSLIPGTFAAGSRVLIQFMYETA